jgi:hypothetical protein
MSRVSKGLVNQKRKSLLSRLTASGFDRFANRRARLAEIHKQFLAKIRIRGITIPTPKRASAEAGRPNKGDGFFLFFRP